MSPELICRLNSQNYKKILVVAESIDVEDSSGTKGRVALIKNLQKAGFELRVFHYTRKEIELPGIPCVAIKENRRSLLFLLSRGERYFRKYFKIYLNGPLEKIFGFSFTLFNDRNSMVVALKKIGDFRPDLVITLSKGGSFRPHHALLCMPEWHSKWVAYIHDPYPMHLYPRPYNWVEPGYYQKWRFMKQMSEKAAFSAFPSRLLMEWMGSYFSGFLKEGVVIPHQISVETDTSDVPDFFEPEKFNILHAGNLLWGRDPMALLQAFEKFLKDNPEAKNESRLLFVGPKNHYSERLEEFAVKLPQFFVSRDSLSFPEVQSMQNLSAVNVVLEAKSEISPFLPGKFPHCVMADKPILLLGPYYSESKRLLGEEYPFWAEIDDTEKIRKCIQQLYEEWKMGSAGFRLKRKDLEEYLSPAYLKKTINQILEKR